MKFQKFKSELTDNQVDDLEQASEDTKSQSEQNIEEVKEGGKSMIKVILINGSNRELGWDLSITKVKDVARILFDKEICEGKYIKLLFAGKVLDSEKTLDQCNVKNNYWLHAIIKNDDPNSQPNEGQQNGEQSNSHFSYSKSFFNDGYSLISISLYRWSL